MPIFLVKKNLLVGKSQWRRDNLSEAVALRASNSLWHQLWPIMVSLTPLKHNEERCPWQPQGFIWPQCRRSLCIHLGPSRTSKGIWMGSSGGWHHVNSLWSCKSQWIQVSHWQPQRDSYQNNQDIWGGVNTRYK